MSEAGRSIPKHVAIIMDGNGRWASARGLPRSAGHKAGIDAVRRAVRAAGEAGVKCLTLYSFSTENWSRPAAEVAFLLQLMKRFIRQDVAELHSSGIRIKIIGERDGLEPSLVAMLEDVERLTCENTRMTLVVAFNYGSRQEILRAVRKLAAEVAVGMKSAPGISLSDVEAALDTAGLPDPDLLIRTGGEERISNFLLWQCAYAEFVFVPEFWPEFNAEILNRAIAKYGQRERRFGGLQAQVAR